VSRISTKGEERFDSPGRSCRFTSGPPDFIVDIFGWY
jgi:hypothetical protein